MLVNSTMWNLFRNLWHSAIRLFTAIRLRYFSLSLEQADWWSDYIRFRPQIFRDEEFNCITELSNGIRFNTGVVDHIERHVRLSGKWDEAVEFVLSSFLRPGDVFLDVGANVGYFTLFASKLVGESGRVVAVEPSRRAIEKFLRNIKINQLSNVALLSVAAGDRLSVERLSLAYSKNIGGSSIKAIESSQWWEDIVCVPLGPILNGAGLAPSVVKMDIEGFELFALKGLIPFLKPLPVIVLELSPLLLRKSGSSAREMVEYMAGAGYMCEMLSQSVHGITRTRFANDANLEAMPQCEVLFIPTC